MTGRVSLADRLRTLVARAGQRLRFSLLRLTHPQESHLGIDLLVVLEPGARAEPLERVKAALDLIGRANPVMLSQVQRYLKSLVILPAGLPEYRHQFRACFLSVESVLDLSADKLALLIVHEATHGRLYALGVEGPSTDRERIERICVRQELALARRLGGPDGDLDGDLVEFARRKLDLRWWEPDRDAARRAIELDKLRRSN